MKPEPVAIAVLQLTDVALARHTVRTFSGRLGFNPAEREELALAVSELASNLIKYGGGGSIRLSSLAEDERTGIRIESDDAGPGIADAERALTDGYSTSGSLGIGLGTVHRLMDELEFRPEPRLGLHIVCQRWLRPTRKAPSLPLLEFGMATRARRMAKENGDAVVLKQWDSNALAGVIDGLGHGAPAQVAAHKAREYLEQHFDQPLPSLFRGVGRTCRGTRGVVLSLGRFELARQRLELASVGNVETRMIAGPDQFRPLVRRGVLGLNAPSPVISEYTWTPASILIMHSDGLQARWQWTDFSDLAGEAPGVIALALLRRLGKIEDDATVIVVKRSDS